MPAMKMEQGFWEIRTRVLRKEQVELGPNTYHAVIAPDLSLVGGDGN